MLISQPVATLLTIAYADQFNFPLNETEIYQRLIKLSISRNSLQQVLMGLERRGLIKRQGQFWQLSAGEANSKLRLTRAVISQQKWLEVAQLVEAVSWIPWVKGVAVTGSLAVNNVVAHDDIDLMVVVAPRRLWLTRVLVSCSTLWAGKRRTWRGNEQDSWCFNLWLDDQHLSLSPQKRNLYSAYEVCQAKWVLDRGGVEKKFYEANSWVKNLLPHFFSESSKNLTSAPKSKNKTLIVQKLLDLVNYLIFIPQYFYMYPHMSREQVNFSHAYFHPRSTQGQIYQRWGKALQRLWKRKRRVVLVTGVFDLFHQEHQNFLRKAKAEGEVLVVGIESDVRVKKNKGQSRPVNDETHRLQQLQLFSEVDLAFILPEKFDAPQDHLALLKLIKPQVLAVSSHTPHLVEKQRLMKQVGGEVKVVYEQNPEVSTTRLNK